MPEKASEGVAVKVAYSNKIERGTRKDPETVHKHPSLEKALRI